jgi:two-component system, chemotaxis family, chemotaxis protein CheY
VLSPLSKLTFLVVDDNEHMVRILRTVLKGFGVEQVHEAADAAAAFQVVREHPIDMALVDVNLGLMDGLAFVRLMRTAADSPNPYLPIIMVSGYSELYRVQAARDAGAHDFVVKPFAPVELHRKITDAIDRPRAFIRSADFQGPDRRRQSDPNFPGPERRVQVQPAPAAESA